MSTRIDRLIKEGKLVPFDHDLAPGKLPIRKVLMYEGFDSWAGTLSDDRRPGELMDDVHGLVTGLNDFRAREKLGGIIRSVNPPKGQGIFNLHAGPLRLFGWAPDNNTLILAAGANKSELNSKSKTYKQCAKDCLKIRKSLGFEDGDWKLGEWHEIFKVEN